MFAQDYFFNKRTESYVILKYMNINKCGLRSATGGEPACCYTHSFAMLCYRARWRCFNSPLRLSNGSVAPCTTTTPMFNFSRVWTCRRCRFSVTDLPLGNNYYPRLGAIIRRQCQRMKNSFYVWLIVAGVWMCICECAAVTNHRLPGDRCSM